MHGTCLALGSGSREKLLAGWVLGGCSLVWILFFTELQGSPMMCLRLCSYRGVWFFIGVMLWCYAHPLPSGHA